jgi:hypothetical protein
MLWSHTALNAFALLEPGRPAGTNAFALLDLLEPDVGGTLERWNQASSEAGTKIRREGLGPC